jgi:hypothetical protein
MIPSKRRRVMAALERRANEHAALRHVLNSTAYRVRTNRRLKARAASTPRCLEIGPGPDRIGGFETLSAVGGSHVDYRWEVGARPLPFRDQTFELIYASHVLEHIPWYQTTAVLAEWFRVLSDGGTVEIWVPDGLRIARAFVEAEDGINSEFLADQWFKYNARHDSCLWASGRIFSYGDGTGRSDSPNWHRALFSYRFLASTLREVGFKDVCPLSADQVRGYDHGWINLGVGARK